MTWLCARSPSFSVLTKYTTLGKRPKTGTCVSKRIPIAEDCGSTGLGIEAQPGREPLSNTSTNPGETLIFTRLTLNHLPKTSLIWRVSLRLSEMFLQIETV